MKNVRRILAPTDMSELSRDAVRYALETAKASGADVVVYHVIPYEDLAPYFNMDESTVMPYRPVPEIVAECRKELAKFLRENFADLLPKVTVRTEIEVGLPYKRIVERAVEEDADMIVISTHGRTGLLRMFIGSVTEWVVRLAHCPVVVIRPSKAAFDTARAAA
jgi:nucleotide-binding universal stress UspA family protein